jgi:hypothetical protein
MVRTAGLEPTTSCSGGKRSIRLSYARTLAYCLQEVADARPAFKTPSPKPETAGTRLAHLAAGTHIAGMLQRGSVRASARS